ncbi:MAG: N-acetylmuramoyl-L-alanine amidase [Firmicutes bacterium]|nr:N-acetylmuramoyl-L-alanine amidase [Bacillota bacterium]
MKKDSFVAALPFYLLVCIVAIGLVECVSRSVSAGAEATESSHVIILDAGHGGEDGGATSCTGVLESSLNLQITLRLAPLLELLGYETKSIRTTDTQIYTQGQTLSQKKISDLHERVKICNECAGAVLVSIHQNIFADSRYSGAQVFYAATADSAILAAELQEAFAQSVNPGSTRQCKRADGVYLMENITCPGVLVECGFLSNPEEEAALRDAEYQKKLCCVIAATLAAHLSTGLT